MLNRLIYAIKIPRNSLCKPLQVTTKHLQDQLKWPKLSQPLQSSPTEEAFQFLVTEDALCHFLVCHVALSCDFTQSSVVSVSILMIIKYIVELF